MPELSTLGSVIKTAYEAEANTNAYTNAEKALVATALQPADVGTAAAEDVGAFASAAQGDLAEEVIFSVFIETVADQEYVITYDAPFDGQIDLVRSKTESGTCTVTGFIEATDLGGTANSASTTAQEQVHATDNTYVKGNKISIVVSSNAAATDLQVTLYGVQV